MAERLLIRGLDGRPGSILVEDGSIAALDVRDVAADTVIDGQGLTAAPGFIELQVNGIDDFDFATGGYALWSAGVPLAGHGITSYLPTIVTGPLGSIESALEVASDPPQGWQDGAVPIGVHLEGPFLSAQRRGAHDPAYLIPPDLALLSSWLERGARMVTLAPELPAGLDAIRLIVGAGAVAAIGHTDADASTVEAAVDAGARYATHLFNAMPPMHHRAPGAAGAVLADERVTVGVIADGRHVDPTMLAVAARAASGRLSIVSDLVSSRLGHQELAQGDEQARLSDGTLAGGTKGLDAGVRAMAAIVGREAAIEAVTATPARLLGLSDGRGTLRIGGVADIVLLDADLEVALTLVHGAVAFRRASPGPGQG